MCIENFKSIRNFKLINETKNSVQTNFQVINFQVDSLYQNTNQRRQLAFKALLYGILTIFTLWGPGKAQVVLKLCKI